MAQPRPAAEPSPPLRCHAAAALTDLAVQHQCMHQEKKGRCSGLLCTRSASPKVGDREAARNDDSTH
eukprot:11548532-Alexandrium_andersonii.AAC.1